MLAVVCVGLGAVSGLFFVEYYARIRELDYFEAKITQLQEQVRSIRADVQSLRLETERVRAAPYRSASFLAGPIYSVPSVNTLTDSQRLRSVKFNDSRSEMRMFGTPGVWRRRSSSVVHDGVSINLSDDTTVDVECGNR